MPFKDDDITLTFTVTTEYIYSDSADVVAKTLGLSLAALRRIVTEGDDLEVSDTARARLIKCADIEDESFDMGDIDHEEVG